MYDIDLLPFAEAVRFFWRTREAQAQDQQRRGRADQGFRGAVTGGQQMNGFVRKITELMVGVGVPASDIYTRAGRDLPGFFRPTKGWDIVVVTDGQLLAAIELKSQVGPSFGNNFNNRTEEALGSSLDLWTAYREGAFQTHPKPWLGYLFLLEDCPRSRSPVLVREPHFRVFQDFRSTSYAKRYELLCRKLVLERQYDAACFITAEREKASLDENYLEPAQDLSSSNFLSELLRHVERRRGDA
jgi:hypothetical protein